MWLRNELRMKGPERLVELIRVRVSSASGSPFSVTI